MRAWVPVPGTSKGRLIQAGLTQFGARGYHAVSVHELAEHAGVTIGSLYHHFGSKSGIYTTVREDVEQRVLDRMEGAAAVVPVDIATVLLVGFDYLTSAGLCRLLAEAHPERDTDPIETFLAAVADHDHRPVGRILLAAWRAALTAAAGRAARSVHLARVRAALEEVVGHP